jgi:DNA polymerase-1
MTTLLVDGDQFVYKWAFACEQAIEWEEDFWTLHSDAQEARAKFDENLGQLMEMLGAQHIVLTLTGRKNFRKALWPAYKAPRRDKRVPLVMGALREHVRRAYACVYEPCLEADDCLGIMATEPGAKYPRIIVSSDKDLLQVPGLHYRPNEPARGVFAVTSEEGFARFLEQTLSGDVTDHYPGCPGVGEAKARRLVAAAPEWLTVLNCYLDAGLTEADALVQARLARILTTELWDHKRKEPLLWKP